MFKAIKMSLGATIGMTLFSYLVSHNKNEKFLEPLILNQLVYPGQKSQNAHHAMGYILHFLVGLLFTFVYKWIWGKLKIRPFFLNSKLMGAFNGLAGIAGWHLTYKLHNNPPHLKLKKYYVQLFIAHIIFGMLNGILYKHY